MKTFRKYLNEASGQADKILNAYDEAALQAFEIENIMDELMAAAKSKKLSLEDGDLQSISGAHEEVARTLKNLSKQVIQVGKAFKVRRR